jgi:hypothetical protein
MPFYDLQTHQIDKIINVDTPTRILAIYRAFICDICTLFTHHFSFCLPILLMAPIYHRELYHEIHFPLAHTFFADNNFKIAH